MFSTTDGHSPSRICAKRALMARARRRPALGVAAAALAALTSFDAAARCPAQATPYSASLALGMASSNAPAALSRALPGARQNRNRDTLTADLQRNGYRERLALVFADRKSFNGAPQYGPVYMIMHAFTFQGGAPAESRVRQAVVQARGLPSHQGRSGRSNFLQYYFQSGRQVIACGRMNGYLSANRRATLAELARSPTAGSIYQPCDCALVVLPRAGANTYAFITVDLKIYSRFAAQRPTGPAGAPPLPF